MRVDRIEDLIAWQLSVAFKEAVYELLARSPAARKDFRYRDQLAAAASSTESNIVEGFNRYAIKQIIQFLSYARASHAEAEARLKDGICRGHFSATDCAPALLLAKRCCMAILRLIQSLEPLADDP